jgi:hypothetical protein
VLLNELQFLMFRIADGKNHSAAFGELGKKRLGNRGSRGSDEDGVERSKFRQTECAITAVNVYVGVAEACKALRCRYGELRPALDAEYFFGQA